ncbi:MAG: trifunctional dihydropteroate synthetase [Chrysothrix sp. TS-e1954]|nr:MAG: trifunctional dihydropteroate synthetase [Chrysothrix sp. TS-e1954]
MVPNHESHTSYIALGSNLGDRLSFISQACRALRNHDAITLTRTSCLYETKAMYVEDQDDFLNAVVEIKTSLEPMPLLDELQTIESSLNRRRTLDKGPRTIDLDILLYDDRIIEHERLVVPHKLLHERRFVLEPLCDLVPNDTHPSTPGLTFAQLLTRLPPASPPLSPITPLTQTLNLKPQDPARRTHLMSILNVTPDSFSDGGLHWPSTSPTPSEPSLSDSSTVSSNPSPAYEHHLRTTLHQHIHAGATLIDIGGQSTRPNAPFLSPSEETARILPAIRIAIDILTTLPPPQRPAISIDTFHAAVFSAILSSFPSRGVDFILNDISGGTLSSCETLRLAASSDSTVILGHLRGDPGTMSKPPHTNYPAGQIAETVAHELAARVAAAEKAGVPRWRMILDPGFGFAKAGADQNLELLRGLGRMREHEQLTGLPWCVGVSRKGFLGNVVGRHRGMTGKFEGGGGNVTTVPTGEREWATAAAVGACVQLGADVVRVHNVGAMGEVVAVADGVWRV